MAASCWIDFILSHVSITSVLAVIVGSTVALWFFLISTNKSIIRDKTNFISINGIVKETDISTLNTLEDVRQVLLADDYIPVTLHDKAFVEPKYKTWQQEDSSQLRNFFEKVSSKDDHFKNVITETTSFVVKHLKQNNNTVVNFSDVMSTHALNILYETFFGRSFELNDPRIMAVKFDLESIVALWPKFNKSCPQPIDKSDDMSFMVAKGDFITRIKQAIMLYEINEEEKKKTLIEDLLKNAENEANKEDNLAEYLLMVFLCAYETLSTLFSSTMLLLAENSKIQDKIFEEVKKNASVPELLDNAYFTQATIQESLRIIKLVPFSVHCKNHKAPSVDENLGKDLAILDFAAILHDTKYWDCPEKCKPERYFDSMGKITNNKAHIPFSLGARSCPGQILAEIALGILLISIVKNVRLSKPESDVTMEEDPSIKLQVSCR